jgi:xanthine dehydrogenase iron-sulfur cluster and FAD-binding subunit A
LGAGCPLTRGFGGHRLSAYEAPEPMKPAAFQYHAPKTIDEAVAMLAEYAPDDGRVLAGGQSLVPTMAFRLARPHHLIDINGIAALDRLAVEDGRLVIGATRRSAGRWWPGRWASFCRR